MSILKIGDVVLAPFALSTKPVMDYYLAQLDLDTSDYTFAANYLWLSNGSGFYAIIEDSFCFFLLSHGQLSMLLPPIGQPENAIAAMHRCFALMEENNDTHTVPRIEYVDEFLLANFVNDLEAGALVFDFLEDYIVERALVDYIYHAQELIDLPGAGFSNKRNEINRFKRVHSSHRLEMLVVDKHRQGILSLLNKWIADRMRCLPQDESERFLDGIYSERVAIKRMLNDYTFLNLIGLVILIDDEIKGFTVGEKINQHTASVIVEKTDFEVFGCAQFIFREFAKILANEYQVENINVGDDMGFDNLKKVKMSYKPSRLIAKYTIYKKSLPSAPTTYQ
ncbi:DUF2156 domain-containing protein [Ostreibacterium oceani]|uniref:DUF2156 domain-containing protein n=1 Tax=Ostreibacterium oceani TaxID=2654998 RepID=A0A6N7EXM6_9GAMM|nr:phosphatidylglycerol lysyltransferase domain-containing protein [Ostreibacterium oceani]MPV86345.1 DUF2156 domain-containing protein [Ostreibacterium oceani]